MTAPSARPPAATAPADTKGAAELSVADTIAVMAGGGSAGPAPATAPSGASRWRPRALLGEGGMGRVYEAEDLQFGRSVALKELTGDSPELSRRFAIEALVTGNLEHPGIPAVYERGEREGRPFYVMKKLEGRSLEAVVAGARTLEDRLAIVPVVIQVAHTLGFAHARGIVHRDIKPENVMVGPHGEVWVVDWGIAKVRGARDEVGGEVLALASATGTRHGSVMGTPSYMAPEQARGEVDAIDERTDVFALGAILYHVLSGRAPYEGADAAVVVFKALSARREPLRALAPGAPAALCAIVERAMEHDPGRRFGDAGAMAAAIERFMAEAATGRSSLAVRAAAGASGVAALGVAIFGGYMTVRSSSSFREQGFGAQVVATMTLVGLLLSVLEWRTRGRHALLLLSAGAAVCTLLGGLGATFNAYGAIARAVPSHFPPSEWGRVLLQGVWEASGLAAAACQLTVFQVLVIVAVARATRAARRSAG